MSLENELNGATKQKEIPASIYRYADEASGIRNILTIDYLDYERNYNLFMFNLHDNKIICRSARLIDSSGVSFSGAEEIFDSIKDEEDFYLIRGHSSGFASHRYGNLKKEGKTDEAEKLLQEVTKRVEFYREIREKYFRK